MDAEEGVDFGDDCIFGAAASAFEVGGLAVVDDDIRVWGLR